MVLAFSAEDHVANTGFAKPKTMQIRFAVSPIKISLNRKHQQNNRLRVKIMCPTGSIYI